MPIASFAHDVYGALPGWLTLFGVLVAVFYLRKGGATTALDTLVTANHVLAQRVKELEASDRAKDKEIAKLMARTDVALALSPLLDLTTNHERRAQERHLALLVLLEMIASRLGTDAEASP